MTNVALIGCAHIHTPGFVRRLQNRGEDVTVTAVWDHQPERAQMRAEQLDAPVIEDLQTVWSDESVSAVIICTETDRHEPIVTAAAAAGKHLFVEKPLGLRADDAYRMADAIEQAGVLFQTGYFQRGHPYNQFLRQQIEAGSFGQVTRLRHSNCHGGSLGDWFTPEWLWMTDMDQAGVGGYGDLGTHSLDIMLWLLGTVTSATAGLGVAPANYGPDCDEFGEGLLKFENGAVGSLAASWVDIAHPVNIIVAGTEGHAYVANGQLYFKSEHVEGADGTEPWTDLPEAWPHAFELFLDAVGGKADVPLVGPREAAERSAVMEALYEGARSSSWVAPKEG